jgi:phage head maturation protease
MADIFYTDVSVNSVDGKERTVEYVASTDAVDSYGEIVEQDWRFDRFQKNPVILYNHNRHTGWGSGNPADSIPIGRATKIELGKVDGKKALKLTVQFAPAELNEFADKVYRNVEGGFLKGGSVGFWPHDVRAEVHDDVERYILSDNELMEFSATPIGANPDAVALTADGNIDMAALAKRNEDHRALLRSLAARPERQNTMEIKELQAQFDAQKAELEKTRSELETAQSAATAATTRATELNTQLETAQQSVVELTTERDELRERVGGLEDEVVAHDVDKWMGKKLTPSEREVALGDRKREGREAFEKRMGARADLNLTEQVTAKTGKITEPSHKAPAQSALLKGMNEAAAKSA